MSANRIPFYRPSFPEQEVLKNLQSCLENGWLTYGSLSMEFEHKLKEAIRAPYLMAVNSGTSALILALRLADLPQGSEVILPSNTFIATLEAVVHLGLTPVLADIHLSDWNLDIESARSKITDRTSAMIVVPFAGMPPDLHAFRQLCEEHSLKLILDNAHALEARLDGKYLHEYADFSAYSFYATKNLTTGEGGALVVSEEELEARGRKLLLHGMSRDAWKRYTSTGKWFYDIDEVGYKMNFTDLQASLGLPQIKNLEENRLRRKNLVEAYREKLEPIGFGFQKAAHAHAYEAAYHLLSVQIPEASEREKVTAYLDHEGIGYSVHFIPIYKMSVAKDYQVNSTLENNDIYYKKALSLPLYLNLCEEDIYKICKKLSEAVAV